MHLFLSLWLIWACLYFERLKDVGFGHGFKFYKLVEVTVIIVTVSLPSVNIKETKIRLDCFGSVIITVTSISFPIEEKFPSLMAIMIHLLIFLTANHYRIYMCLWINISYHWSSENRHICFDQIVRNLWVKFFRTTIFKTFFRVISCFFVYQRKQLGKMVITSWL